MTRRRTFAIAFFAAGGLALASPAAWSARGADEAADFPRRPIRIVIGFTPGGQPDITARTIAAKLTESLGQPVVVDNRPGAGGTIGTKIVADANPDGYTLLSVSSSLAISPSVYAKLPYDTRRDLAGVTRTATAAYVLVAPLALNVRTAKDLVALARARPGQLNFGSAGVGSGTHFAGEVLKSTARIDVVHVPYKGIPEALTDTMTGRVQFFMTPPATLGTLVKDGKIRALGVSSKQRIRAYPDLPTIAESGVPGFHWETWAGILAPAKTPRAIVNKLNAEITRALALPDVRQRFIGLGAEPAPTTPAEFDKLIAGELLRVAELARNAGIKPQ
ncbi:MAG: tripartite tricarboxylate transporter substrate binding protein [Betaproteobacteria bacterium]|nr:tripartite tricarboxylate transporter substrate binding protein [Betaproteobacteria bacterium]